MDATRRKQDSRRKLRWLTGLILLSLGAVLACGPKVPPPPPEFSDPQRTPTGSQRLEGRILATLELTEMDDQALAQGIRTATSAQVPRAELNRTILALLQRGLGSQALTLLHRRALAAPEDEGKSTDALNLAMGLYQWGSCASMATQYVKLRHNSGAFLVRALCLWRSGEEQAARDNLAAAYELVPLDASTTQRIELLLTERGDPGRLDPGPADAHEALQIAVRQNGPLSRLFVDHLVGRSSPPGALGSLQFGGVSLHEIREIVRSRSRSYRHCYNMASAEGRRRDRLSGLATIEFIIDGAGRPTDLSIIDNGWGEHPGATAMDQCLVQQLSRLRFPMPAYGQPLPARHRFAYAPE